tara:strand:+ start:4160 stop:4972 length:813 start_codon:yes stop_codon:yes gene_type:complete
MTKTTRNRKGRVDVPADGRDPYCGPAAITCITGKKYDIVEKELCKVYNKKIKHPNAPVKTRVHGMNVSWMGKYLRRWHNVQRLCAPSHDYTREVTNHWTCEVREVTDRLQPTVAQFLKRRSPTVKKNWVLIWTRNHFMLCKGNKVWDNIMAWEKRDGELGVSPKDTHMKRARVESAYLVKYRGTHWNTLDKETQKRVYNAGYYDEMEFDEVSEKTLFTGKPNSKRIERWVNNPSAFFGNRTGKQWLDHHKIKYTEEWSDTHCQRFITLAD